MNIQNYLCVIYIYIVYIICCIWIWTWLDVVRGPRHLHRWCDRWRKEGKLRLRSSQGCNHACDSNGLATYPHRFVFGANAMWFGTCQDWHIYIYMYILYIHIHIHIPIHVPIHIYLYDLYIYIYLYMYLYIYTYTIYTYTYTSIYMNIYIHIYICNIIHTHIYICIAYWQLNRTSERLSDVVCSVYVHYS